MGTSSPEETRNSLDSFGNVSEAVPSYGNAILELVRSSLETWKVQPWHKVGLKHVFNLDLPPQQWEPLVLVGFSRKMGASGSVEFLCQQSK